MQDFHFSMYFEQFSCLRQYLPDFDSFTKYTVILQRLNTLIFFQSWSRGFHSSRNGIITKRYLEEFVGINGNKCFALVLGLSSHNDLKSKSIYFWRQCLTFWVFVTGQYFVVFFIIYKFLLLEIKSSNVYWMSHVIVLVFLFANVFE